MDNASMADYTPERMVHICMLASRSYDMTGAAVSATTERVFKIHYSIFSSLFQILSATFIHFALKI